MITEFTLEGSIIIFEIQFNPDAIYRYFEQPVCYQCRRRPNKHIPLISPGYGVDRGMGSPMPGWMIKDNRMIPGGMVPKEDIEIKNRAIAYLLKCFCPRIVHAYGGCFEGWMRDEAVHPGIAIRHERYKTIQGFQARLKKFSHLKEGALFCIYKQAEKQIEDIEDMLRNSKNVSAPTLCFSQLLCQIRILERSKK